MTRVVHRNAIEVELVGLLRFECVDLGHAGVTRQLICVAGALRSRTTATRRRNEKRIIGGATSIFDDDQVAVCVAERKLGENIAGERSH